MARDFKVRPTVNGTGVLLQGEGTGVTPRNTIPLVYDHSTGMVFTNMPVALTESAVKLRSAVDLSWATRVRLTGYVAVAGPANSEVRVQYSTDQATWNYLDSGTGPLLNIGSVGAKRGSWVNLVAGAKADAWLRVMTINGDGALDPNVASMLLHIE